MLIAYTGILIVHSLTPAGFAESAKNGAVSTPSTVVTNKVEAKEQIQKKVITESAKVPQTNKVVTESVSGQRELVDIYAEKYASFLRGNKK